MVTVARLLVITGVILVLLGGLFYLFARTGIPFGRLPGDIRIQGENVTCLFPLVSMILLSVVLTIILNIAIRFLNR